MITYDKESRQLVCTHYIDPYEVPVSELYEIREELCSKELMLRIRLRKLKDMKAPKVVIDNTKKQLDGFINTISSIEFIIEERIMEKKEDNSPAVRLIKAIFGDKKDEK